MFRKTAHLQNLYTILLVLILVLLLILPVLCIAKDGSIGMGVTRAEKSIINKILSKIIPRLQQKAVKATLVGSKAEVRDIKDTQVIGSQNIYITEKD